MLREFEFCNQDNSSEPIYKKIKDFLFYYNEKIEELELVEPDFFPNLKIRQINKYVNKILDIVDSDSVLENSSLIYDQLKALLDFDKKIWFPIISVKLNIFDYLIEIIIKEGYIVGYPAADLILHYFGLEPIPKLTNSQAWELLMKISQIVRFNKEKKPDFNGIPYYIRASGYYKEDFVEKLKPIVEAKNIELMREIYVLHEHSYDIYSFETVVDILAQIPKELHNEVVAFEITTFPKPDRLGVLTDYVNLCDAYYLLRILLYRKAK